MLTLMTYLHIYNFMLLTVMCLIFTLFLMIRRWNWWAICLFFMWWRHCTEYGIGIRRHLYRYRSIPSVNSDDLSSYNFMLLTVMCWIFTLLLMMRRWTFVSEGFCLITLWRHSTELNEYGIGIRRHLFNSDDLSSFNFMLLTVMCLVFTLFLMMRRWKWWAIFVVDYVMTSMNMV